MANSPLLPRQRASINRDFEIQQIARDQRGLITYSQLRACGLGDGAVRWRVTNLRLHRVHRNVFALGHNVLDSIDHMMASVLAVGPSSAVTGRAALHLWEVRRAHYGRIDVVTPRRFRGQVSGARVTQARSLVQHDVVTRHGVAVTSVPWTLFELGRFMQPHDLARIMHELAYRELLDLPRVCDMMLRHRSHKFVSVLSAAVELHVTGSAGFRSALERAFYVMIREANVLLPDVNTIVQGWNDDSRSHEPIEADFHWPSHRLCVETDGPGHTRPYNRRKDAERSRWLRNAGFTVIRCVGSAQFDETLRKVQQILSNPRPLEITTPNYIDIQRNLASRSRDG